MSICPKEALVTCRNSKYVLRLQRNVKYKEKSKNSLPCAENPYRSQKILNEFFNKD